MLNSVSILIQVCERASRVSQLPIILSRKCFKASVPQSTSKYPEQTHLQQLQVLDALNQTHGLQGLQDYLS